MPKTEIKNWDDIKKDFLNSDLILGNGFSINLHSKFNYNSLFDNFISNLEEEDGNKFKSFNTTNFEFILQQLRITIDINKVFSISCVEIEKAIEVLREGLIKTVQENHPKKSEINWDQLKVIANNLSQFNDIYTLSYDALLYHIILLVNDKYKDGESDYRYNDYFWESYNDHFLEFMDYQNYANYKHIYYLHGALFIFKIQHYDVKIRNKIATELIEAIAEAIKQDLIPLFISEGTAEDKLLAISKSYYLKFSNNMLKVSENNLVVYGTSLLDQDNHIVDAINNNKRSIAISIYVSNKSDEQIEDNLLHYKKLFKNQELVFFDSSGLFS